ncbi:hypothetical protein BZA05DRAFT_275714 [Tricharina praecox]|uniref:uncharacterized protein n=1 Tax=Tricharina praecox TaxID=43433 RepID=UPI00221F82B7|nr:uncharacterized protein BZA05DRAFT_275714 [Tricharina praecox]KAI5853972.1 hypothetical protein BZA05DRAFT_275714 [Tricharina praecox]
MEISYGGPEGFLSVPFLFLFFYACHAPVDFMQPIEQTDMPREGGASEEVRKRTRRTTRTTRRRPRPESATSTFVPLLSALCISYFPCCEYGVSTV